MQFCAVLDEGFNRLTAIRHVREQDKQLSEARQVDSVGILAAGVAHNFNNFLQAIMGNIYMAKLNASSVAIGSIRSQEILTIFPGPEASSSAFAVSSC